MEHCTLVPINGYDGMSLPTGFRFQPTDQELIAHYLSQKVINASFSTSVIGEVNSNRCDPWELPFKAKKGEKAWYFFCLRDRKYPNGFRTNRATKAGYWKATGKDKEIYREKMVIGMKKTLVFYTGRAPKGEKTYWFMHEYRLAGKYLDNNLLHKAAKNEWLLCRVFCKDLEGRKDKEVVRVGSCFEGVIDSSLPPPLVDDCHNSGNEASLSSSSANVTCFSYAFKGQESHGELLVDCYNFSSASASDGSLFLSDYLKMPSHGSMHYGQEASTTGGLQQPGSNWVQVLENNGLSMDRSFNVANDLMSISHECMFP